MIRALNYIRTTMPRTSSMLKLNCALALLLMAGPIHAEYRVYQYYVRTKIANISAPAASLVTSTLDPQSYAAYNGGASSIEVNLLRSWLCLGNTSKLPPCTISEGKELSEGNAE